MLYSRIISVAVAVVAFAPPLLAHPGEKVNLNEVLTAVRIRNTFADVEHQELSKCGDSTESQLRMERAMKRRLETFKRLRKEKGIEDGKQTDCSAESRKDMSEFANTAIPQLSREASLHSTPDQCCICEMVCHLARQDGNVSVHNRHSAQGNLWSQQHLHSHP